MNKVGRSSIKRDRNIKTSEVNFSHLDAALDEALKQSFPASDPIAIDFTMAASGKPKLPARPATPGTHKH